MEVDQQADKTEGHADLAAWQQVGLRASGSACGMSALDFTDVAALALVIRTEQHGSEYPADPHLVHIGKEAGSSNLSCWRDFF